MEREQVSQSQSAEMQQRLCSYDNMVVEPLPEITRNILSRNNYYKSQNIFNFLKRSFSKISENFRLFGVICLLISPVSGGPFILPEKITRSSRASSLPLRHLHRELPRVGIGIIPTGSFLVSHTSVSQGLPFASRDYFKSQIFQRKASQHSGVPSPDLKSNLESAINGNTPVSNTKILRGIEEGPASTSTPPVPNPSGSPLLKVFELPNKLPSSVVSKGAPSNQIKSPMDDSDNSSGAGRERRASSGTPGDSVGGGKWMKPCPNLDSERDENATPATLSTLIVRAIHEALSQVDKFKNDFAKETFHVNSWEESLSDHQDYSLPFLSNSSSVDLGNPESVSFPQALQEAYEMMQRRAVGIEQVTLDQALYQSSFLTEFRHVEDRIVHVLCELSHAMNQSGVDRKQISKDVMGEETRDMEGERERNIRDAVILREYMAALQVLHALFNHYMSGSQ